jgi:hypothetical protein
VRPGKRTGRLEKLGELRLEPLDRFVLERGGAEPGDGLGHAQRVCRTDGLTEVDDSL